MRLRHSELHTEITLPVALVIEAMELQVAEGVRIALSGEVGHTYTAGAIVNGGASVGHCVAEGMAIAETIHMDIST